MARRGELFEKAVYEFYRTLDPDAEVLFDHKVADRDTGTLRQVDVWVRFSLGGHVPITVLISCKDHNRPLDIGDIETFLGEIRSTRATTGVIYGRSGFTAPAIEKARAHSVACCRLFENQPPERPTELLMDAYIACPRYEIQTEAITDDAPQEVLWNHILETTEVLGGTKAPVVDLLVFLCAHIFASCQEEQARISTPDVPMQANARYDMKARPECPAFRLHVVMVWDWFRARVDAYRMTGSLNVTDHDFKGDTSVGLIPAHSGPFLSAWERCRQPAASTTRVRIFTTACGVPLRDNIRQAMGPLRVFGGGPWTFAPPAPNALEELVARELYRRDGVVPGMVQITVHFGKKA